MLETLDVEYSSRASLPELARDAQRELALHPEVLAPDQDGVEIIRGLLGALVQIANGVAALRNQYGIGHGRAQVTYGLRSRHAHLAVGAADTYCRMLLSTLADSEAPWRRPEND